MKKQLFLQKCCSALCAIAIVVALFPFSGVAFASNTYSTDRYSDFLLKWGQKNNRDILLEVKNLTTITKYTYNENNQRTSKSSGTTTTTFAYNDCGGLISETRNGCSIVYEYEYTDGIGETLSGFVVDGSRYKFVKDENQTVVAILNDSGTEIARYEYCKGVVSRILGLDSNGAWVDKTNDPGFVGTVNMIRYFSNYYDAETGWYYCERYYDSVNRRFVICSDKVSQNGGINARNMQMVVDAEVNRLLTEEENYGDPITYSSGWYNNLEDVEILARLIYGECTGNLVDQRAIDYCILNRLHGASYFGDTLRSVATKPGQFSTITSTDPNNSFHARSPQTGSDGWYNATYIAVSLVKTMGVTTFCESLFSRPLGITNQTQFLNFYTFINNTTEANGDMFYRGEKIKSVVIAGVGEFYTKSTLRAAFERIQGSKPNIHFSYDD